MVDIPAPYSIENLDFDLSDFSEWNSLNDTIMGGSSKSFCSVTSEGLLLQGNLIEKGGGFVSCRSKIYSPSLDLSCYQGFHLELEGEGRTLKFGVSCEDDRLGVVNFFRSRVRWIVSIPTNKQGTTVFKIPFSFLEPAIRAKPVKFPVTFDPSSINQFQLLHSKFGQPGKANPGFRAGSIRILLRSLNVYS